MLVSANYMQIPHSVHCCPFLPKKLPEIFFKKYWTNDDFYVIIDNRFIFEVITMDLFSLFKGGKYFDKHIDPKCDYCQFGRRTKEGNKVLCEKRGMVDCNYSCSKFIYSPLKRIPVKQLNFVGSLADEDIYMESAGDIAEKQEETVTVPKKAEEKKPEPAKAEVKPAAEEAPKKVETPAEGELAKAAEEAAKAVEEAAKAAEEAVAAEENAEGAEDK